MIHGDGMSGYGLKRIRYLSLDDVIKIHRRIIAETGGEHGLLSPGSLAFTLERMRERKEDVYGQAAFLLYSITTGHPFINGNKRTAFITTATFLRLNGYELVVEEDEVFSFLLEVAQGKVSLSHVKSWIKQHARNIKLQTK